MWINVCSYTDVQKILDGDEETVKKYEVLVPMLVRMKELAALLREKRRASRDPLILIFRRPR